jgi:histone H3
MSSGLDTIKNTYADDGGEPDVVMTAAPSVVAAVAAPNATKATKATKAHHRAKRRRDLKRVARDIKLYQNTTQLLIPRRSFFNLVKEISALRSIGGHPLRMQSSAISVLQEASEAYLIGIFQNAQTKAEQQQRATIVTLF